MTRDDLLNYWDFDGRLKQLGIEYVEMEFKDLDEVFADTFIKTGFSSNVAGVRYSRNTDKLYVLFDNHREKTGPRLYEYPEASNAGLDLKEVYDEIWSSSSPGGTVWDMLRRSGAAYKRLT